MNEVNNYYTPQKRERVIIFISNRKGLAVRYSNGDLK